MKIAMGCDPNAEAFKQEMMEYVTGLGHEVTDFGSTDTIYANVAIKVAEEVAAEIPVLYGGSVNPGNANQLIQQPSIDGLFTGRSAWQADPFNTLIRDAMASAERVGK